jgi:hypothetical protein
MWPQSCCALRLLLLLLLLRAHAVVLESLLL